MVFFLQWIGKGVIVDDLKDWAEKDWVELSRTELTKFIHCRFFLDQGRNDAQQEIAETSRYDAKFPHLGRSSRLMPQSTLNSDQLRKLWRLKKSRNQPRLSQSGRDRSMNGPFHQEFASANLLQLPT
jgi:hypothetical protein